MKTMKTNDIQVTQYWKILEYGKSGIGKTYTASTLKEDETLIITPDRNGLKTLSDLNWKCDYWFIEDFNMMRDAWNELLKKETQQKYKNVFVDDLTEINELAKKYILEVERPATKGDEKNKIYDEMMQLQDYALLQTKMNKMIRAFRDVNYNVIFTCLEDQDKDESTGKITFCPSLNGKFRFNIMKYFDCVFRLLTDKGERWFLTDATDKSVAKGRGSLETLEQPNFTNILNKLKGGK